MQSLITTQTRSFLAKRLSPALLAMGILSLVAASSTLAGEDKDDRSQIFPPQSQPYGKTYAEWSAVWWQWALAIPADHNPLLDETGADAGQGQSGHVWFLAGVFNATGTAERTNTVPAGKALFFPIVNNIWISTVPTDPQTADAIRPLIAPVVNDATDLACEIDGVSVKHPENYRTESPLFNVTLPANNIFGIDAGTYGPSMDEGFYLMVAPLSVGRHTIHFHGALTDLPFTLDITYHLTVKATRHSGD